MTTLRFGCLSNSYVLRSSSSQLRSPPKVDKVLSADAANPVDINERSLYAMMFPELRTRGSKPCSLICSLSALEAGSTAAVKGVRRSNVRGVNPRRSLGVLECTPRSIKMKVRRRVSAPMHMPSSKITLSRGDAALLLREMVMSSGTSTNTAKSLFRMGFVIADQLH